MSLIEEYSDNLVRDGFRPIIRDLQIRLRLRVRVFQCVPGAHARLREAVTSTRSVDKISSPS